MFSLQFPKLLTSRLMRPLALLAITALAAPGAALAASNWTAVGSTGVLDELCSPFAIQMNGAQARSTPGLVVPCKLRYQITDTNPLAVNKALLAHIRDTTPSGGETVIVNLIRYEISTGRTYTEETINSNLIAGTPIPLAPDPQVRSYRSAPAGCPGAGHIFNFLNNSYWIEVDLLPAALPTLTGFPAINLVAITNC